VGLAQSSDVELGAFRATELRFLDTLQCLAPALVRKVPVRWASAGGPTPESTRSGRHRASRWLVRGSLLISTPTSAASGPRVRLQGNGDRDKPREERSGPGSGDDGFPLHRVRHDGWVIAVRAGEGWA
jgi:hypothetical protein